MAYANEGLYYDGNGDSIAVNDVQGDLMDSQSHDLFAKAGWNFGDARRLQLTANRFELEGNNDYHAVNGNFTTGQPATSARGGSEGSGPRNRSTELSLDYTDRDLAGGAGAAASGRDAGRALPAVPSSGPHARLATAMRRSRGRPRD